MSYILCIPFTLIILWFWLTHIDRLHMRDNLAKFGEKIRLRCQHYKYWNVLEKYFLIQLNGISELTSGFTYGILNKKPIIKIVEVQSNDTQTDISGELEPVIIIKEIEIIKEILINNNLNSNNLNSDLNSNNLNSDLNSNNSNNELNSDLNSDSNTNDPKKTKKKLLIKRKS